MPIVLPEPELGHMAIERAAIERVRGNHILERQRRPQTPLQ